MRVDMNETRFTDNGMTISDTKTGLMWEKKTRGDDWRRALNAVNASLTWEEAKEEWIGALNAQKFSGFSDWRLPQIEELLSIVDYRHPRPPAINPVFGLVATAFYWTATPLSFHPGAAWRVFFLDGAVFVDEINNSNRVRAVRNQA